RPHGPTRLPYTTRFRSNDKDRRWRGTMGSQATATMIESILNEMLVPFRCECQLLKDASLVVCLHEPERPERCLTVAGISDSDCRDRKSTRLNSSHVKSS